MKPAFALDFRDTTVRLLHRTGAGWQEVGQVSLDAPDLTEALGYLRATALGLSPRGISTKLVIPNDQILYTQVHAPGPDAAKRRSQIKAALEGRTPYAVKDLVFDWWGNGPDVQVAVIAKETLAEAEAFAADNRFNPVSFVAAPENGTFKGEPWFGPSSLAPSLLAPGEKVERHIRCRSSAALRPNLQNLPPCLPCRNRSKPWPPRRARRKKFWPRSLSMRSAP
jgi:hypothetical protein